jgi:hypothetical protein
MGAVRRVEAAVDTDQAAARLAVDLDADALVLVSSDDARRPVAASETRIDVVRGFVDQGGWLGAIAPLPAVAAVLHGEPAGLVWGRGAGAPVA